MAEKKWFYKVHIEVRGPDPHKLQEYAGFTLDLDSEAEGYAAAITRPFEKAAEVARALDETFLEFDEDPPPENEPRSGCCCRSNQKE
jgi:hypothetical protein